jgi:hypothetical protein
MLQYIAAYQYNTKLFPAFVNNVFYFLAFKVQNKAKNHGFGVYQQFQKYYARKAGSIPQ